MGRGTGLNVFGKRNISFPYREWNHSLELNYYWQIYPGFLQTRNPKVNSRTSADRGAVDAALRPLPYFLSLPSPTAKRDRLLPSGFHWADYRARQEKSSLSLSPPSLPPNNQLKAHYTRHNTNNVHRCRKFANAKWCNLEMYFRSVVILWNEISDVEFVTAARETGFEGLATGSSDIYRESSVESSEVTKNKTIVTRNNKIGRDR